MKKIMIKVNEREKRVDAHISLDGIRERFKADADLIILNGFPITGPMEVKDGDEIVLIKKGEVPPEDELEALMAARHSPGVHQRVRSASVGIAGIGGLGSLVAVALARVGVGHLVIADFDIVEPSNLNRQQYFVSQIGMPKTKALMENLALINPYVRVSEHYLMLTSENIPEVFAPASIIVEAFDKAEMKEMIINTVMGTMPEKILVAASGLAGYGPSNEIRTERIARNLYIVGDQLSAAQPGRGLMAPRVGIAAHHQANAVLRVILGIED